MFALAAWAGAGIITGEEFVGFPEDNKALVHSLVPVNFFTDNEP